MSTRCVITMAVWGAWHVETFLEINLPTLMAPGNFPAFARGVDTHFIIYTPPGDQQRMRESPLFRELLRTVRVEFVDLTPRDIEAPIATHNRIWDAGRSEAIETRAMAMVMPPDITWSDGSLAHLAALMQAGKTAIFLNWHLRAVAETFIPQFRALSRGADQPIALSGRELVRLTVANLHPLCAAYLSDSRAYPYHSEMMFWPVPRQGLLMHVFALIPFVFDPAEFELNDKKLLVAMGDPSRLHCVKDSDDLFMTSLASIGKDSLWYRHNSPVDPVRFAMWWSYYDSPSNDLLMREPFRLHYAACDEADWRRTELGARRTLLRLLAGRELYRIYLAAQELGCRHAAQLIAAAMHLGLAPLLARPLRATSVFLPEDEAFGGRWEEIADELLRPGNTREFIAFMRAHALPSAELTEDSAARLGLPAGFDLDQAVPTGEHRVYAVPSLLRSVGGRLPRAIEPARRLPHPAEFARRLKLMPMRRPAAAVPAVKKIEW